MEDETSKVSSKEYEFRGLENSKEATSTRYVEESSGHEGKIFEFSKNKIIPGDQLSSLSLIILWGINL